MDDIIKKLDLYELLEVEIDANIADIKRAYRKKALKCHPDKNPGDLKAVEAFRQLSKALEILSDDVARDAYNKILRARKEQQLRNKSLDSKRKRFKEELEAKERAARQEEQGYGRKSTESDEERLKREIERLRREGSKILEQENEYLRKQIEKEILELKLSKNALALPRLKCKWDRKVTNYDEISLRSKFNACGRISCLVVSKKGNSAMIEFEQVDAAVAAYSHRSDQLRIEWVQGKPSTLSNQKTGGSGAGVAAGVDDVSFENFSSALPTRTSGKSCYYDVEYEQKVLDKLRHAQRIKSQNVI